MTFILGNSHCPASFGLALLAPILPLPAIYIGDGLGLFSINLVQQGCEDTPGFPEFITTDKVHLAPTEDIQDEAFIGIRELHILQVWERGNVADNIVLSHPGSPLGTCPDGPPC